MKAIVENLEDLNNAIDSFWNGDKSESQIKKINAIQRRSGNLIDAYKLFERNTY